MIQEDHADRTDRRDSGDSSDRRYSSDRKEKGISRDSGCTAALYGRSDEMKRTDSISKRLPNPANVIL